MGIGVKSACDSNPGPFSIALPARGMCPGLSISSHALLFLSPLLLSGGFDTVAEALGTFPLLSAADRPGTFTSLFGFFYYNGSLGEGRDCCTEYRTRRDGYPLAGPLSPLRVSRSAVPVAFAKQNETVVIS